MKLFTLAGLGLLSVLLVMPPQTVRGQTHLPAAERWQSAGDHIKRGEQSAANDDWVRAGEEFAAAGSTAPVNVVALYDLGVADAHLGKIADAAQSERQAVGADPGYAPAYIELGWILTRLGDYQGAAAAEQKALQLDPSNKTAQKNLELIERFLGPFLDNATSSGAG